MIGIDRQPQIGSKIRRTDIGDSDSDNILHIRLPGLLQHGLLRGKLNFGIRF